MKANHNAFARPPHICELCLFRSIILSFANSGYHILFGVIRILAHIFLQILIYFTYLPKNKKSDCIEESCDLITASAIADYSQSSKGENWDEHFGKLVAKNYRLVSGNRVSVRFTLLFKEAHVMLRAHFVQNT